eukprot:COSAG01_NODE_21523_length_898_cov_1.022528_2_plen_196_part_01
MSNNLLLKKKEAFLNCLNQEDQNFVLFSEKMLLPMLKDQQADQDKILVFLSQRYDFFKSQPLKELALQLKPLSEQNKAFSLELLSPDMPLLLMTLEEVLRSFDIHVTRIYHPIIPVSLNTKDYLQAITSEADHEMRVSFCYIEFESALSKAKVNEMLAKIEANIKAVTLFNRDQDKLSVAVRDVQEKAKQFPTPLV